MARRGRFGRLPRVSPGLSQALANIAREMQNQRAQNLMSAWEKGGTFEGQKATDELVIKFWKDRLAHVDKQDPLYDTYKNAVTQYEYAIEESKMTAAYATGRRTDGQMVAFYQRWARKVPKNSELWRQLQRDAGQYMRNAKAGASQRAAEARERAYQRANARTRERFTDVGEYLFEVLRKSAEGKALIGVSDKLSSFDSSDPAKMLALVEAINGVPIGPGRERVGLTRDVVLYLDPGTGQPVTGADVRRRLGELDPSFDGTLSQPYIASALDDFVHGASIIVNRANKTAHSSDANGWGNAQSGALELAREVDIWPLAKTYEESYRRMSAVITDPTSTPEDRTNAIETHRAMATALSLKADPNTASRLVAEANGDLSTPTLHEDVFGFAQAAPNESSDAAATQRVYDNDLAQIEAVRSGEAVWTSGAYTNNVFSPSPGGPLIGAASLDALAPGSVPMFLPHGNKTMMVVAQPQPITTQATDADGYLVPTANAKPLGQYFEVSLSGNTTQVYQMKDAQGRVFYTIDPPFGPGTTVSRTATGLQVDVSGLQPRLDPVSKQWLDPRTGQPVPLLQPGGWNGWTAKVTQSGPNAGAINLQYDPSLVLVSSDPSRQAAGFDKRTDFVSPAMAALATLPRGEADKTWEQMKNDPVFQAQLQQDILAATAAPGGAINPASALRMQTEIGLFGWRGDMDAALSRTSFAPTFETPVTSPAAMGGYRNIDARNLPLEQLRRLPETPFGPLSSGVREGSNLPAAYAPRPVGSLGAAPTIKTNIDLKVPSAPASTYQPPAIVARPAGGGPGAVGASVVPSPFVSPPPPSPTGEPYKPPSAAPRVL